jgi:hypothetical protein
MTFPSARRKPEFDARSDGFLSLSPIGRGRRSEVYRLSQ